MTSGLLQATGACRNAAGCVPPGHRSGQQVLQHRNGSCAVYRLVGEFAITGVILQPHVSHIVRPSSGDQFNAMSISSSPLTTWSGSFRRRGISASSARLLSCQPHASQRTVSRSALSQAWNPRQGYRRWQRDRRAGAMAFPTPESGPIRSFTHCTLSALWLHRNLLHLCNQGLAE